MARTADAAALLCAVSLSACAVAAASTPPQASTAPAFALVPPAGLPDFSDSLSSKKRLAAALRRAVDYLKRSPQPRSYPFAGRDVTPGLLASSAEHLLRLLQSSPDSKSFAAAVKRDFDVYASPGSDGHGDVIFSAYYEPVLDASLKKSPHYPWPIYRKPRDLVEADLGLFDKKWSGTILVGRVQKGRFVPYFSRREIDVRKALAGKGLEIAWLKDRFDILDLHVEGSGILKFPSGREKLVNYGGTNDLPYHSIGLMLVKTGAFSKDEISADKVKDYLRAHPEAADWILEQNPRYVFFNMTPLPKGGEAHGTAGEMLVPGRSVAVDPSVIPLGALLYFSAPSPRVDESGSLLGQYPTSRFATALDTGGAIKGPGRIDIYVGHGKRARMIAHNQWSHGKLYVLLRKPPPPDR